MSLLARFFRPAQVASSSRLTLVSPVSIRQFSSTSPTLDKLKSHSGTKKRFFKTGSGLVRLLPLFLSCDGILINSINEYVFSPLMEMDGPRDE